MRTLDKIFGYIFIGVGVLAFISWVDSSNESWLIPGIVLILLGIFLLKQKEE